MKQRIYEILIIVILIFIIVNIYNYYRSKNRKVEIETSSEPIQEKAIDTESEIINTKPIDSNVTDWNLILVNKDNPISGDYTFEKAQIEGKWYVDIRIKEALEQMLLDAKKQGLDPIICSSYRTSEYQTNLFNKKVKEYIRKGYSQKNAEEQASLWVTIPGTSEHEIGLAVDIVGANYQILDKNQENTAVQKWLMEHCYEYGFILRYPTEKKEITMINYEPWHYRYVGVKDAMVIKEKGFCLEEYIKYLKEEQ